MSASCYASWKHDRPYGWYTKAQRIKESTLYPREKGSHLLSLPGPIFYIHILRRDHRYLRLLILENGNKNKTETKCWKMIKNYVIISVA